MKVSCAIVGAQKAGTTSLMNYLGQFSGVTAQSSFEFPYFARDDFFDQGFESAIRNSFANVPTAPDTCLAIKSVGILYLPWASQRLFEHNPDCKVVVCIREPVSRAYSAYWYLRSIGQEPVESFEEAIDMEADRLESSFRENHHFGYLDRGRYLPQVNRLTEQFGRANVHIIRSTALRNEPERTLASLASFVGDDVSMPAQLDLSLQNETSASRSTVIARNLRTPTGMNIPAPVRASGRQVKRALGRLNRNTDFRTPKLNEATKQRLQALLEPDNLSFMREFPEVGEPDTW